MRKRPDSSPSHVGDDKPTKVIALLDNSEESRVLELALRSSSIQFKLSQSPNISADSFRPAVRFYVGDRGMVASGWTAVRHDFLVRFGLLP